MGGGASIAAMISSLKNNNNLRLNRKRLFNLDRTESISGQKKTLKYKHMSEAELLKVKEKLKEENRTQNFKKIIALTISIFITAVVVILILIFSEELFSIFKPVK